jgi:hypothetical protein
MSKAKRILLRLMAVVFAAGIFLSGGCDAGQFLLAGLYGGVAGLYGPLYPGTTGYFPFTATPFTPGFGSFFSNAPVLSPGGVTIPEMNTSILPDTGNSIITNNGSGGSSDITTFINSQLVPNLGGGLNSGFGSGTATGQILNNPSGVLQNF